MYCLINNGSQIAIGYYTTISKSNQYSLHVTGGSNYLFIWGAGETSIVSPVRFQAELSISFTGGGEPVIINLNNTYTNM